MTVRWGELAVVISDNQLGYFYLPTSDPLADITRSEKIDEHRFRGIRDDGELGEALIFEPENNSIIRMWRNNQYATKVS